MRANAADPVGQDTEINVTGLVEGLVGSCLVGWAIDTDWPRSCAITVVDGAGILVASGDADRPRGDLAGYGFGRIDFAFRIDVPGLGGSDCLRVFADGAELAGSPLATGAGRFDGAVSLHDGWAEGWVRERTLGAAAPMVVLYDQDDGCLGTDQAIAAGPPDAPGRFRIRLDAEAWRHPELQLRAAADGVVFAAASARLALDGYLDRFDDVRCAGWLLCPQTPSVRFDIEAFRDGALIGGGTACLPREDLRAVHPQCWKAGFDFELTAPRPGERATILSLRMAGTTLELLGGPFLVGSGRALASVAKRVAARAMALDGLEPVERAVLQTALKHYIAGSRDHAGRMDRRAAAAASRPAPRRLSVLIPVYRDVGETGNCIDSVLATRDPQRDAVVLINDASPEAGMAELLAAYAQLPQLYLLTNADNCGFVQTVNRGLAFCRQGDVVLLNSDTCLFDGALEELWSVAQADRSIGTVTALSNNATIFSYPVCDAGCAALDDIGWADVAEAALAGNRGLVVDVPTGHGFCMLLTRQALDQVGAFDEIFGRGYGEENDFCLRAADMGLRSVAACGAFVQHRESVSFGSEKSALLKANLPELERRYPEYAGEVRGWLARDDLRAARWTIDAHRLRAASEAGATFTLVVRNWLDGGTGKAIADIAALEAGDGATALDLCVDAGGTMRLGCAAPLMLGVFAAGEQAALLSVLGHATIAGVAIHQLLGYSAGFIAALRDWEGLSAARFYVHDHYPLCPRVTMIDAIGVFCDVAPVEVCARCVELGGAHDASRMDELSPAAHRALFAGLLSGVGAIVAPSASAAAYLRRGIATLRPDVMPHPEVGATYDVPVRAGSLGDIVLLGALGPHKGSAKLLEIARRARMVAPELQFHVLGYTDIDAALRDTGNVSLSGPYEPADLPALVDAAGGRLALFLHRWPETFSYTLSEAVQLGLVPLVPDIGAPAERVRAAGFGHVFGFPIRTEEVVDLLLALQAGRIDAVPPGAGPSGFAARQ